MNIDSEEDEDEESKDAPFILIQGAHVVGKMSNQCEDSYFISDRGFGVSDGVSGWNDYGFSSDQFSLQLMFNSKKTIEKAIESAMKNNKTKIKKGMRSARKSYLSMDNLDIEEEENESDKSESSMTDKDEEFGSPALNKSDKNEGESPENTDINALQKF